MPVNPQQTGNLDLRDIHLPDAISWWPPAPGWWGLAGLLVLLVIVFFLLRKLKQRRQLQKSALAELEDIQARYLDDDNTVALVQSLSILLRRACISFYPRANTASLTGEPWLDYLDKTSTHPQFKNSTGKILATAPYLPENSLLTIDASALITLCESWLRAQPVKQQNMEGKKS